MVKCKKLICFILSLLLCIIPINAQEDILNSEAIALPFIEENKNELLEEIMNKYHDILEFSQPILDQMNHPSINNSRMSMNGGFWGEQIILENDLYIYEDVTVEKEVGIISYGANIYVMPKFQIALKQCEAVTSKLLLRGPTQINELWNQLLIESDAATTIPKLKNIIYDILNKINEEASEDVFYEQLKGVLEFLLNIDEIIPTAKLDHSNLYVNLYDSTIFVSNYATLHINQGFISRVEELGIKTLSNHVIEISSKGQLLGAEYNTEDGIHVDIEALPFIMNTSLVGSVICYQDSYEELTMLSNLILESNATAIIQSNTPLYLKSVEFDDPTYQFNPVELVEGESITLLDECKIGDEIQLSNNIQKLKRTFSRILSSTHVEIHAENFTNWIYSIPNYLSMELNLETDSKFMELPDSFKELIINESTFTTRINYYTLRSQQNSNQGMLIPYLTEYSIDYSGLINYIINDFFISLEYKDVQWASVTSNAVYFTEDNKLAFTYIIHPFMKFTPYLYNAEDQTEVQLGKRVETEDAFIDLTDISTIIKKKFLLLEGIEFKEGSVLRLKFDDNSLIGSIVDIPIKIDDELLIPDNGKNDSETTGGGGRNEVIREPVQEVPDTDDKMEHIEDVSIDKKISKENVSNQDEDKLDRIADEDLKRVIKEQINVDQGFDGSEQIMDKTTEAFQKNQSPSSKDFSSEQPSSKEQMEYNYEPNVIEKSIQMVEAVLNYILDVFNYIGLIVTQGVSFVIDWLNTLLKN